MNERFSIARRGAAVTLVFDDGAMNLLSASALEDLAAALRTIPPETVVIEFRSGRRGIFAAGADMAEMRAFGYREAERFSRRGQDVFRLLERAPFASVAAIDGDCFGGALDLVMAFDFRVATPRSRFSHPGSRIGIVTGFGGTARWRKVVPPHRSARLFLSSEVLDAETARSMELVDAVDGSLDQASGPLVARLAATPRWKMQFAREIVSRTAGLGAAAALTVGRSLARVYSEGHDGTD